MSEMFWRMVLVAAALVGHSSLRAQAVEARISAEPFLSPNAVQQLEAKVRANPEDKQTRLRLLRHYMVFAPRPGSQSPFQSARLGHILYLIENSPSDPTTSSALTYVPAAYGPFASPADHASARDAWMRAVDRLPSDDNVLLNSARFLYAEHPEEAEQFLSRAVERNSGNRQLAANLGFFYAMDVLGMRTAEGQGRQTPEDRQRLEQRARVELDLSRNAYVLAGAGTALPNLFPRTEQARSSGGNRTVFELASALMVRARALNPQDAELAGPMPLIREFQAFQHSENQQARSSEDPSSQSSSQSPSAGATAGQPTAIRVGGTVQASKLIEKPEAMYPSEAKEARIQGVVRFNVVIGPDGSVQNATLMAGHPLFVPTAVDAVRRYRYQPTLLNGAPIAVISQVDVPFTLPK